MLITPAFAQAAAGGDTNSMLMSLLPFALIFVIMYFLILRPQQKKVKDHAELVKKPLGECASSNPGGGLPGAGSLENVPPIEPIVLQQARQIGVAGAGPGNPAAAELPWRVRALVGHDVFPVGPVPIRNQHGHRRPQRLTGTHTGEPFDVVTLDLHTRPTAIALHPPGELVVHPFRRDWEAGRQTLDDGYEGLAMRFACSGDRVLGRSSAHAGY